MNVDQLLKSWNQIVARAWQDDAFRRRLVANPSAALKEAGLEAPSGIEIRIVENTDTLVHLTLPAKPLDGEISEDELDGVAGGNKVKPKGTVAKALLSVLGNALDKPKIDISNLPQDTGPRPK